MPKKRRRQHRVSVEHSDGDNDAQELHAAKMQKNRHAAATPEAVPPEASKALLPMPVQCRGGSSGSGGGAETEAQATETTGLVPILPLPAGFEAYYREQGIVPDGEWDAFASALGRELPCTFRLSGADISAPQLRQLLADEVAEPGPSTKGSSAKAPRDCTPGAAAKGWILDEPHVVVKPVAWMPAVTPTAAVLC